jgi:deoxyxylulose-5-phosphate synthase
METLLTIQELKHLATEIRKDTLRSITAAGSGIRAARCRLPTS